MRKKQQRKENRAAQTTVRASNRATESGLTVAALILGALGLAAYFVHGASTRTVNAAAIAPQMTTAPAVPARRTASYWLTGNETPEESFKKAGQFAGRVQGLLKRHADDNALAHEVWERIGSRFFISRALDHNRMMLWSDAALTRANVGDDVISISVVAGKDMGSVPICSGRSTMCYEEGRHELVMPAEDMSDAWLAGLLYHEMGHALRYKQIQALGGGVKQSDAAWTAEEVEMHTLENVVLDAATDGHVRAYYEAKSAELSANGAAANTLCTHISEADAFEYFRILDVQGDRGGAFGQLCLSLGFAALEKAGRGSVEEKSHLYATLAMH